MICPGDSGGAAYLLSASNQIVGPRSIVGLNSGYKPVGRISAISIFDSRAVAFIEDWSRANSVAICGIHQASKNCRDRYER